MSDNGQKTAFAYTTHKGAEQKAHALDHNLPKNLPATIQEVNGNQTALTVSFDMNGRTYTLPQVTVPHGISRYFRVPFAKGDKGYVTPGSVSVTPSDKLGPLIANFTNLANLSTGVFHPIADTSAWPAMIDPQANEHTAPNGHYSHTDDNKGLMATTPASTFIAHGGSQKGVPGPQNFQAHHDGTTEHNADSHHTAIVGGDYNCIVSLTHKIQAQLHDIDAPANVSGMLAANGGLSVPAGQSLSIPSGSIPAPALASGAAATNVGTLGGDLSGTLPQPEVVGLTHVDASNISIFTSNALARAGGVPVGGLYVNNSISGTERVLCVAF